MYDFIYDHYSRYDVVPPPNVIGMVTAENQRRYDERTRWLMETPFAKRGISIEPMLGPVRLHYDHHMGQSRIDWCIVGCETGPKKRPMDLNWARGLRNECQHEGIPFFFKMDSDGNHTLDGDVYEEFPSIIDRQHMSLLI